MQTCAEISALVTTFLDGKLGFYDRMRFRFHVGMCRHCRAYLKQMRTTIATLGQLPADPEPMPPEVRDELLRRFRTWKPPTSN